MGETLQERSGGETSWYQREFGMSHSDTQECRFPRMPGHVAANAALDGADEPGQADSEVSRNCVSHVAGALERFPYRVACWNISPAERKERIHPDSPARAAFFANLMSLRFSRH
jgi:hypothetical protein